MHTQIHHVIGGGTVFHVRPHLALCAPAYGTLARTIAARLREMTSTVADTKLHLTKMADPLHSHLETNADIATLLDAIVAEPRSKIVFLTAAICDFEGVVEEEGGRGQRGKAAPRLKTIEGERTMRLTPSDKLVGRVRADRKDVFLVACKTTAGATPDEQYVAGLRLLENASANLVLANDLHTRLSMVITPERARHHETTDRAACITSLVDMAVARSISG